MAKFKEGDIIDVPMRVINVGGNSAYVDDDLSAYTLAALDMNPGSIGVYTNFIDAHARPSNYEKAQPEPLPPAETPIAVGDVVRLRSGSPPFTVDTVKDGKAGIFVVHGTPNNELKFFGLADIPLACLKKDSD